MTKLWLPEHPAGGRRWMTLPAACLALRFFLQSVGSSSSSALNVWVQ